MARRRKRLINSRLTIAVLGEGITEREYFKSLKKHSYLPFKFKPEIPKHSDIQSIVNKAKGLKESFDVVFCIIDLDRILANPKEKQRYCELKLKNKGLIFIENNPCFEIWFLLHFEFSTRAYYSCNALIKILKKNIPDYIKSENYLSKKDMFYFLENNLGKAIENSVILKKSKVESKCDMHKVIHQLNKQKI
ncbi:MAG: RloB domain-containing protein [Bacteroidetes bacterium]|nr:MAG: RloB domain-containing protein [Bacteroidota bacterium]RLD79461.1 MAG: RloB domain-containing protein [Bacteroidota bacterium]